ncbi:hypothetical protein PIB30_072485 [Stylosanthes scabra]|uniref:Uncharacterized protein n=1 Tax=Stylosanthes scabra TaxID=79078 RepID=A0ABU6TNU8_9FABA|nr:hypothetical protein [Stylosanthes scabra]
MSWIYQRFPRWCLDARSAIVFLLASRLNGLWQDSMVATRLALDRLVIHEFVCTPYDDPTWDALCPAWMLTAEEQMTLRAVIPIVCFMYVRMHHVDRVKRQLGGEQHIPEDPVNLDEFLDVSARGED